MSQHDFNIANQGFPNFRADLNNALAALASLSSGATEPATTYANQLWYDTANNYLKYRNEANSDWIVLFGVTATGIRAIDELQVRSAGAEASVNIKNTNTGGTDPDANLYLDAGNVDGEAAVEFQKGGTSYGRLTALDSDMRLVSDTGQILFSTGGAARATISNTGISADNLLWGTYTPTLTAVTNVAATTASVLQYCRVGNVVTVSGYMQIDPTTTSLETEVGISLPIASSFGAASRCGGAGGCIATGAFGESAVIVADTTNNRARFLCKPSSGAARGWSMSFTYQVV